MNLDAFFFSCKQYLGLLSLTCGLIEEGKNSIHLRNDSPKHAKDVLLITQNGRRKGTDKVLVTTRLYPW